MEGFEPPASCSQSRRATNCATPGYYVVSSGWADSPKPPALPTALYPDTVILFSAVCGHLCGQSGFLARFGCWGKSRKCPCCKGFRALAASIMDENTYAPKAGALPTALHPVIDFERQMPKTLGEKGYSGNRDRKFLIFLRKSLGQEIAKNSGKH